MLTVMVAFLTAGGVDQTANSTPAKVAYEALPKKFPGGPSFYTDESKDRGRVAAARVLAFARDHRDVPEAVEALGRVASHCLYSDSAGEAMTRIAKEYARSPDLARVIADVDKQYGDPFAPNEAMLRVVLRESPHLVIGGTASRDGEPFQRVLAEAPRATRATKGTAGPPRRTSTRRAFTPHGVRHHPTAGFSYTL
jgi:hypothetical protein